VVVAEADPASIRLEDREDLHVKPDPDAMTDGHTNGVEIKASVVLQHCWPLYLEAQFTHANALHACVV